MLACVVFSSALYVPIQNQDYVLNVTNRYTVPAPTSNPFCENAKLLYDNGLRLASPKERMASTATDETISSVALLRGEDPAEWDNQPYPLFFVFHNYALEGSSLENIQAGYDSSKGYILSVDCCNHPHSI